MRLITYRTHAAAAARLGAIVDDLVIDLQALGEHAGQAIPGDMLAFIDLGPHAVASTSTLPERVASTAGLIAGSIATIGMWKVSRSVAAAATLTVLQASTIARAPRPARKPTMSLARASRNAASRSP